MRVGRLGLQTGERGMASHGGGTSRQTQLTCELAHQVANGPARTPGSSSQREFGLQSPALAPDRGLTLARLPLTVCGIRHSRIARAIGLG